jgi:mRNA interferase RelE/StbE
LNWKIEFDKKAKDELFSLDASAKKRIIKFIEERLLKTENPRSFGAPLKGKLAGLWKYRIGDYRLVCHIEDEVVTILVVSVGHRKSVYKS